MLNFGKLYDIISDEEKKSLITYLIKEIQIYPNGESDMPLKSIEFNFPIYRNGQEVRRLLWEKGNTVETVVKLSLKKDTPKIEVTMEPDEESNYTPEEKATYQKIKEYVKDKYGVNVHTSYIAQVKRMCGLDMGENYNKSKKENPEVKQCQQEKVEYIKDALRHYGLL